jgi:hypothetical protein
MERDLNDGRQSRSEALAIHRALRFRSEHVRRGIAMWVALEVNIALWGMILCAAAERFAI